MTHILRNPCKKCGHEFGRIVPTGGQNVVRCAACDAYANYNAPKTETGEKPRSVSTCHESIRPKTRTLVLMRANGHCELCGRPVAECNIHVGHLLSVKDGFERGLSDAEINHEENLAAFCEECNLGMGKETVPLRLAVEIVLARVRNRNKKASEIPA